MNKFFGTVLSSVFVLSIVGAPRPLIGTGDVAKNGVKVYRSVSIDYPSAPPEPIERSLPKYTAPEEVRLENLASNTIPAQEGPTVNVNLDNWTEIKEEFDREREEIKQEREEKLARMKEDLEEMRKDIQDAVEKAKKSD